MILGRIFKSTQYWPNSASIESSSENYIPLISMEEELG